MRRIPAVSVAERFARLALDCIGREFPNHPLTVLLTEEDLRSPREHTPAFFGCFDWHSAVHAHWTLARLLRIFPEAPWSDECRTALRRSLTAGNLAQELRHLSKPGREGFERPYGLAWLLQLTAELHASTESDAPGHVERLAPLAGLSSDRILDWLAKLTHPIRIGEHSQTAFAIGLTFDYATEVGDHEARDACVATALRFFEHDCDLAVGFEPSGHDFLSPSLGEADLMRRVLTGPAFPAWLDRALPNGNPLSPVISADRSDGKLAHLDGLNLSRAWMLDGVASALDEDDPRRGDFERSADQHAAAGLASVTGEHYAGGHWLGTFATYLLTGRGVTGRGIGS